MEMSHIAANAKPSATLALNAQAKRMVREGQDVVPLALGEPDFETPEHICQAAHRAIEAGYTRYTPAAGMPELREAIAAKLRDENELDYAPEQVIVCNGAKQALYMLMLCLVEEGDDVLLPAPYWVSYAAQARFCGARPVAVDTTGNDLRLTADLLQDAVTAASRLLVLNSPSNPTGVVLTGDELRGILDVAARHDLWVISDEVYEKLIYDEAVHVSPAGFGDEALERVITVNAVSKTYAMTGWRIGYAAGPQQVIKAATSIQSNTTSAPNTIAQKATITALTGTQEPVAEMRDAFDKRRRLVVDGLNEIPGVRCVMPEGAFYVFPDCSDLMGRSINGRAIENSLQLCEALLEEALIALTPGSAFGAEGYVRLSYAASTEEIEKALERFVEFVDRLEG